MTNTPPRPAQRRRKPLTLNRILSLDEEKLKERYPHGIFVAANQRFVPAEFDQRGIGHTPLKELLQRRKLYREQPRFLHRQPGIAGPLYDKEGNLDPNDDGKRDYTEREDRKAREEPEPVDEGVVEEFAKANGRRYEALHEQEARHRQWRLMSMKLRQVQHEGARAGVDLAPKLAVFLREAQAEVAAAKRKAA